MLGIKSSQFPLAILCLELQNQCFLCLMRPLLNFTPNSQIGFELRNVFLLRPRQSWVGACFHSPRTSLSPRSKKDLAVTQVSNFSVTDKGSFETEPADLSLRIGDTAMFECKTQSLPAATYIWTRNGRDLTATSRIKTHGRNPWE